MTIQQLSIKHVLFHVPCIATALERTENSITKRQSGT